MIFATSRIAALLCGAVLLTSCATTQDDPLKNTRKLVKEGHADLYNNGAFRVPNTQISLIPAAPSATELGLELMGLRASQSFEQSLQNARDSVYVVSDGTKKSFEIAGKVSEGTHKVATAITDFSRPNSKLLIYKSVPATKQIIGQSFELESKTRQSLNQLRDDIVKNSARSGLVLREATTNGSSKVITQSWELAGTLSQKSNQAALGTFKYAGKSFIQGYAAIPGKAMERASAVGDAVSWEEFSGRIATSNQWRETHSSTMTDIIVDTRSSYTKEVGDSFAKAGEELDQLKDVGILAALRATRWVLQGLFWDGVIKPFGKVTAASVGYITINTVAFPVMVVSQGVYNVAELAVQVTWNSARFTYDLVAPTVIGATAALFGTVELIGGNLAAGTTATVGTVAGGVSYVGGQAVAATVEYGGRAVGEGVKYIGVPLASTGIVVGGTTAGVVTGGVAAASGTTLLVAGEISSVGTQVFGNTLAGGTAVVGTTASAVGGTALGIYELTKAVVVPAGYELGGGLVLGYASASQLAAHSILAVSDAAYLVLSLEGPRWVIYAVSGKLNSGEELTPGTMLDLKAMQESGEEFRYLPVSDDEIKRVIESAPNDMPRIQQ